MAEVVKETGVTKESGYLYYLDNEEAFFFYLRALEDLFYLIGHAYEF